MAPDELMDWKPAPEDAINLAALRMYMIRIELLVLAIYRSDPDLNRPLFVPLEELLASHIQALKDFAAGLVGSGNTSGVCPGNDVHCDPNNPDLCFPPGTCS